MGRYVILAPIGEGGMGVVYKAYDPELDRSVALKLMKSVGGNAGRRERLLREAQALAQLSHPNVIAVHDVGTLDADVFIAMEFVEGATLRRWLKEAPRSQRQIMDVLLAAGEGLRAAHQAGLVHRDFKPDNVMVGTDGRVRVLDFGLARAAAADVVKPETAEPVASAAPAPMDLPAPTVADGPAATRRAPVPESDPDTPAAPSDRASATGPSGTGRRLQTPLTHAGTIVGTPSYMAPEQYLGQTVDQRADQFSFCVCLYQALYGALPFDGETTTEQREAISVGRFSEPPAHARVPRWMRQALVRGLQADPAARYPSMAELLRTLQADPRIARARWLPLVATVALLAVAASGWQVARRQKVRACAGAEDRLAGVWDDARRNAVRTAFRASDKPFAEAALSTVERVFDGYAHAWVAMHVDACEATHVRGEQSGELLDLRMTCLNDRLTQLKTLSELFANADAAVVERAPQSAQSLPRLEPCADAAQLRAPISPPQSPQARQRIDEVRQRLARAHALDLAARFDDGLQLVRAALSDVQTLHYPALEAEAQLELGQLLDERGDYRASADAQYQALVMALGGRHDQVAANAALALFTSLGVHQAHYDEGDHWAGVAEALARRLHDSDDTLGMVYSRRSTLRWSEGKYEEALDDANRALALQLRVLGPDHYLVAETYHHLGNIYDTRADSAQALDNYQRAVAIMQRTLGPNHPRLLKSLVGIADVYGGNGEHERAIALYQQALDAFRRVQPDHPSIPLIYNNMAGELQALGRPKEAVEKFQRALDVWQEALGPSQEMITALAGLGAAKLDLNQPAEALKDLLRSQQMCERVLGPKHAWCGDNLAALGEAYRRLQKPDEALALFRRSLSVSESALGSDHPQLVKPLIGIGRVELGWHSAASAIAPLSRALAIREAKPGDAVELADIRFALAQALWATGERARAETLASQAQAAFIKAGGPGRRSLAELTNWLARRR